MNFKKLFFSFLVLLFVLSCKKEAALKITSPTIDNAAVNNWIYQTMNTYYLWSTNMPALSATDVNVDPMNYFTSILYDYENTDRFSWIDSSSTNLINELNGINKIMGIRLNTMLIDDTQPDGDIALIEFLR